MQRSLTVALLLQLVVIDGLSGVITRRGVLGGGAALVTTGVAASARAEERPVDIEMLRSLRQKTAMVDLSLPGTEPSRAPDARHPAL